MNLEFQIYDYNEDHDNDNKTINDYIINIFGRTEDDKSVYAKVIGYTPYFYIALPNKWEKLRKSEIKTKLLLLEEWLKSIYNNKIWSKYKETLIKIEYIKSKKPEGFTYDMTTNEEKKFNFARLIFNNNDGMKKYAYFFEKYEVPAIKGVSTKSIQFKLYESNLSPMLRCFHIRKISGCSWVSISENSYDLVNDDDKNSYCDIEIIVEWQNLNPIKKNSNAPFKIASFDIEVFSHDGQFPQAHRKLDKIIQIGITYSRIGISLPYRRWIACLKNTDNLENINVVSFENEDELIDAFISEIKEYDCDIITGYNIFGFDEKYIYDRCDKILNMKSDISLISKLKNKSCNFREMKLASSALGENILKFWETPGRVHIDLLKEIQKTYTLTSYKLDFVASNFIRGEIESFQKLDNNKVSFKTKSINDVQINDYIHIEVIKGFISDDIGDKYLVYNIDVENKILFVNSDSTLDTELEISKHGGTIYWSQAKDDVGPKEIFKFQNEGSDKRAIVAKYCIKDCSLVNLLINKLEIITKNIEMANVCYVPLNYLFIRGQGIKLFSLCLKEFRDQGYIFPVIKVKIDSEGNTIKEDSYEGAIVFDPEPQIDYEANSTKDYASLYPSSIIHKNMSHETEVIDLDNYGNIDGITYFDASFRENDGSIKYIKFAKIDNNLGVIPLILDKLLKERKSIKKLQKTETDQFKWKILEAKQLAVKVTANSLYGQLGASTSPVARRNIAACTTSTGREMLLFAKKYDEELLPWIFNGLKEAYKNNNNDTINFIINKELKNKNDEFIDKLKKYCSETINNYTLQPVVRYGDTDSVFTCFRFKEQKDELNIDESLILFKKIIEFGEELIKPFFLLKDQEIFSKLYKEYYSNIDSLILPKHPDCIEINNNIILPIEEKVKLFLKEYLYENYLAWLWILQEIVNKSFNNINIKLFDWAEYLLSKNKFTFNNLYDIRKDEVIIPLIQKIETLYKNNDEINWRKSNNEDIINISQLIETIFINELDKKTTEIHKLVKVFLDTTLLEEWTYSEKNHNVELTKQKKNLKRERIYNNKNLYELLIIFIETKLKCDFNKYKNEHCNKIYNFIRNILKEYIIQPYWDVIDNDIKYKIKIFNKSESIIDKRTLNFSIELGELSGELVKSHLPFPHDLEYEKTFWPFLILTKKRYVGNKYEFNPDKYKQDFMGIVLKRRDNAPIVKEICSGIINFLINKRDPEGAKKFVEESLTNMFESKYDIKYFLQSRTLKLKESYVNWTKIAHVFLADKIANREGSKLESGNRIEFAAICIPENKNGLKLLQGEMIETPAFIKENNIPINYLFYMKNQIMNPALQFLSLVDKNALEIFKKFEDTYSDIKVKKRSNKKITEDDLSLKSIIKNKKSKEIISSEESTI